MWQSVTYIGLIGFGVFWLTLFLAGWLRLWKQRRLPTPGRGGDGLARADRCPMCGASVEASLRRCLSCGEVLDRVAETK